MTYPGNILHLKLVGVDREVAVQAQHIISWSKRTIPGSTGGEIERPGTVLHLVDGSSLTVNEEPDTVAYLIVGKAPR